MTTEIQISDNPMVTETVFHNEKSLLKISLKRRGKSEHNVLLSVGEGGWQ